MGGRDEEGSWARRMGGRAVWESGDDLGGLNKLRWPYEMGIRIDHKVAAAAAAAAHSSASSSRDQRANSQEVSLVNPEAAP